MPQLYDKISIGAVLQEWYKSINDLPMILRRAVEMGLFSSAQLVRFCSMDIRPNTTRMVSRKLPPSLSRAFVGRLMADPAFTQKLAFENLFIFISSLVHEARLRGDRFLKELDFVSINTFSLMSATTAVVCLIAPSRSFGSVQKLPWQNLISNIPNNIFDASGPLRNYTPFTRITSFFTKTAELAIVGAVTATSITALSHLAIYIRKKLKKDAFKEPSIEIPTFNTMMLGLSMFYGLHAHVRYQLIGGIDRYFFEHSNFIWSYLSASMIVRITSGVLGEAMRPFCQGLPDIRHLSLERCREKQKQIIRNAYLNHFYQNRLLKDSLQSSSLDTSSQTTNKSTTTAQDYGKKKKKKVKGFEMSIVNA